MNVTGMFSRTSADAKQSGDVYRIVIPVTDPRERTGTFRRGIYVPCIALR
jgi:hypothetical protein